MALARFLSQGLRDRATPRPVQSTPLPRMIAVGDRELPLIVRRLRNARRITLRLAPDGSEARLSMPEWGRTSDAIRFAEMRRDWLAAQLARIPEPVQIEPGCTVPYRGETLLVEWDRTARRRPVLDDGMVVVGGAAEGIAARLQCWLESDALRLTSEDLAHYCGLAGHSVPHLALSRAQRRWGSCASDGVIRINWRLVMAPDFVRRSVVAHEVAHMTHFDHSPAFHAHLAALYEAPIEEANRWLKHEGRSLYRPFG
ncbi:MAG: M48 family metallopeptidase [Novosphingobium sp.]